MLHLFLLLTVLLVPLVGGFATIHWLTSNIGDGGFTPARRRLCFFAEAFWLSTPSLILGITQTVSLLACTIFLFVTAIIFLLALAIHRGNDIESFALTAITIIVISFLFIGDSFVASVKAQRNLQKDPNAIHDAQANVERLQVLNPVRQTLRIPSKCTVSRHEN